MQIAVAHGSSVILDALVSSVSSVDDVSVIGKAKNFMGIKDIVNSEVPDLIILDANLPGGNIIATIKVLREKLPKLIILIHSRFSNPDLEKQCKEAGANIFFSDSGSEFKIEAIIKPLADRLK